MPPGPTPPGRRERLRLITAVVLTALATAAVVTAAFLLLGGRGGAGQRAASPPAAVTGVAPRLPVPPVGPTVAGEPPIPASPKGSSDLSAPVVVSEKVPYQTPGQWCSMLTPEDLRSAIGYEQFGTPDSMLLCTHHLADRAGYVFVSDIPAATGAPYSIRGNTAILYQSEPGSCEVSVVLNRAGGVLDIDLRGLTNPRVPPCQSVVDLAGRVFDRLPDR